jgi:uncharacterized membrane protein
MSMLFAFAFTGLVSGLVSLYFVHGYIMHLMGKRLSWFVIGIVSIVASYGIYLGRFLRWNSWDVLTNTGMLVNDMLVHLFQIRAILVTGVFASFLIVSYFLVYILLTQKEKPYYYKQAINRE